VAFVKAEKDDQNPDMRIFHCRAKLTDRHRESSWKSIDVQAIPAGLTETNTEVMQYVPPDRSSILMQALLEIPGVEAVDIYAYHVMICKARLWEWDEITPSVGRLLTGLSYPVERMDFDPQAFLLSQENIKFKNPIRKGK
jgi:hypothetical protein